MEEAGEMTVWNKEVEDEVSLTGSTGGQDRSCRRIQKPSVCSCGRYKGKLSVGTMEDLASV